MACLSSSPPPLMPEDEEEDEDSSFAEGFADLSESDNSNFDLTGLSDKLHSFPKEAIHVAPKEFLRPELETGGNVVIRLNGLGVPQPLDKDFSDDIPELDDDPVPVNVDQKVVVNYVKECQVEALEADVDDSPRRHAFPTLNVSSNFVGAASELASPLESDVPSLHLKDLNDADGGSTSNDESEKVENEEIRNECESDIEVDRGTVSEANFENVLEQNSEECVDDDPVAAESFESNLKEDTPNFSTAFDNQSSAFPVDDSGSKVNDSFGDFAAFETAESNFDWTQSAASESTEVQCIESESRVLQLDDEDDDDDFGDFDSADVISASSSTAASNASLQPFQNLISMIRPKISSVISDLFSPSANDDVDDSCDRSKALDPMADPIWMKIHEIETTPALGMTWSKATTQDQLMKILKIDPRNIVVESKPRKYSPGGVPVFAMGLSTSTVLQPIKAEPSTLAGSVLTSTMTTEQLAPKNQMIVETKIGPGASETGAQALFDWRTSGLNNPLEQNGMTSRPESDLTSKLEPTKSKPATEYLKTQPIPGNSNGLTQPSLTPAALKPRSREAAAILESFPLLNFMQSQALMIPENKNGH